jgi:hypothetical protein
MAGLEVESAVVREADLAGLVLEEEGRAVLEAVVLVEEVEEVAGVAGAVAEAVEAEIKMGVAVLITGSSRASVTGGANSLHTPVRCLSRYKTRL